MVDSLSRLCQIFPACRIGPLRLAQVLNRHSDKTKVQMPALSRRSGSRAAVASSPAPASHQGSERRRWSDTWIFVLALAGASMGFKTIWQFPFLVSQNGGAAFVLVYLLLAFLIGVPLLIAQVMLGRHVHASPITTFAELGAREPGGRAWAVVGGVAVLGGFIVFSYLSVIAGWVIAYWVRALAGTFSGLTADGIGNVFAGFVKDPEKQVFWYTLFISAVAIVAGAGLRRGLDATVRWLAPALYGTMIVLAVYAAYAGSLEDALIYFLAPDFTKLSASAWLNAGAQVFFSFGLGTGVALMYGAYLRADVSIPRAAVMVAGIDVISGIVAGMVVFAVLFGGGVGPASGPSLVFQALPLAFDHLPYGRWFAWVFFALLVAVAMLMGIALFEPLIAWLCERFKWRRQRAALVTGIAAWLLGLVTVFSFNYGAFSFKLLGVEKHLGMFDILQTASAEFMLPLAACGMAIFAGWMMPTERARAELRFRSPYYFDMWLWLLRWVSPLLLAILLFTLYRL